jgi:hypothetical protein
MPDKRTIEKARQDKRAGKSASRRVNLCVRRSTRFVAANMAPDRRSKRSLSAFRKRGARVWRFLRPRGVRPRSARARAPSTPMKPANTSADLADGRVCHARYCARSSANRGAQRHMRRYRDKPAPRPHGAAGRSGPAPRARPRGPRVWPVAQLLRKRRRERGRGARDAAD